jgi:hypothetical protein
MSTAPTTLSHMGSESAVMAYVASDRFLYAGDYIQPGRLVAMHSKHLKLENWSDIERLS